MNKTRALGALAFGKMVKQQIYSLFPSRQFQRNNKAINKAITDTEKLKTDWTYVVEYFANEASKVVKDSDIKVKPKLEVETEDEFVYD